MGITKIILLFIFFMTIINLFYKAKKESTQKKKNKKSNRKIVENYLEKNEMAKLPSLFILSNMKDYKNCMKDIYSSCVNKDTLDEIPLAYKDVEFIKNSIGDNVTIIKQLKPIINIKGY